MDTTTTSYSEPALVLESQRLFHNKPTKVFLRVTETWAAARGVSEADLVSAGLEMRCLSADLSTSLLSPPSYFYRFNFLKNIFSTLSRVFLSHPDCCVLALRAGCARLKPDARSRPGISRGPIHADTNVLFFSVSR